MQQRLAGAEVRTTAMSVRVAWMGMRSRASRAAGAGGGGGTELASTRWPTSAVRRGGSVLDGVGLAGLWIELSSVKHCEVLGVIGLQVCLGLHGFRGLAY